MSEKKLCARCGQQPRTHKSYCHECCNALDREYRLKIRKQAVVDEGAGVIECRRGDVLIYRVTVKDKARLNHVILYVNQRGFIFDQGVTLRARYAVKRAPELPAAPPQHAMPDHAARAAFYQYKTDRIVRAAHVDGRWQIVGSQPAPETDGELKRILAGLRKEGYEIVEDYQIEV